MSYETVELLPGNLAKNLRYVRERRGLTQARVAKLAGVPRSTLALVETFLRQHPDMPRDLRLKVLQSEDELERTVRIRRGCAESSR